MAKNGQQRNYMQVFIPNGNGSRYSSEQALMYGLDKRGDADNMTMKSCLNIDVKSLPNIEASSAPYPANNETSDEEVLGFYAYGTNCYIVKGIDKKIKLYRYSEGENGALVENTYAVVEWENTVDESEDTRAKREMAVFCYYPMEIGGMAYTTSPEYRLLIYPDSKYVKVDFKSGEVAKVIAPKMEYDESATEEHLIDVENAETINADMTIYKDGTVKLYSGSVAGAFEGFEVGVSFTDVNKKVYSGSTSVKGKFIGAETFGIFLKKVSENTATLELRGSPPASEVKSPFYVINATLSDIVYSEDVTIETGSRITKTFQVDNLSKTAKYYAYFDYNLEGNNTLRYELYFTLSDETVGGGLKIDGKLLDSNGNLMILDVAKEYSVSYELSNSKGEAYSAIGNGGYRIKLGCKETDESLSPEFQHITVWNSRLFGMKGSVVVCSCAGTPFDWTLDSPESELESYGLTIGGYDESHAWYSTTQANTKASGDVTAITSYDGHPVIFKDDFMHEIYNTKNPFRIQDICAVGCVSARSVCELDSVLYFASRDGIYRYSGGYPKRISDALGDFICGADTVCGAFDGVLYVYNPDYDEDFKHIYSYNPETGLWAAVENCFKNNVGKKINIFGFASGSNYLYLVSEFGQLGYFPKVGNTTSESWNLETNVNLFGTSNDKRVHSLMIVHDGNSPLVEINGEEVNTASGKGTNKTRVLLRGFDSESIKLKLSGEGYTKIHRIDIVYSVSGRRYKK